MPRSPIVDFQSQRGTNFHLPPCAPTPDVMNAARARVLSLDGLADTVRGLRATGKTVALCHGCFDVLHFGHVRHFEAARSLADVLVVTVTPDRFVGKGPGRPVFPELQRAEVVAGLNSVDWVAVNEWSSAVETIARIQPSMFVKGDEYETRAMQVNPNFLAEVEACLKVGSRVAFTREATSSSTAAVERMRAPRT